MSCETKSSQSYNSSSKIPIFGATGILPPFDKAAHTNNLMNATPHQNNYQNKRPFPENCSIENKVPDRPVTSMQRQENASLRGLIEIDLTCEKAQTRNITNHRQQIPHLSQNVTGGNFNDQSMLKCIMKDQTQTRYPQALKTTVNGQGYPQQVTQNDLYPHANQSQNQLKFLTAAQSTVPKISQENIHKNSQNSPRNPQIITAPYRSNELLQQPKERFLQTREPYPAAIHAGDTIIKNQNIPPAYKNPQHNPYQFNTYGKETNFYPKPHVSSDNFMQNNNLQSKYNPSQNYNQMKSRELIDPKSEMVISGRQIQPNSIPQHLLHGRSGVLKDTAEYLSTQLANHRLSQYECNKMNMNRFHAETQTPNYTQKVNPMLETRQYQNQNLNTHSLHSAPKPMTTPRPTVITEDSTSWFNQVGHDHRLYDYNNETITERQLQEDIINSVEEVTRVSKYSQYPEAKREIEIIKDKLMIDAYQNNYSAYPYAQQEYSSIARKRPNEMSQNPTLKKQILSTQNPHINLHDFSVESPPNKPIQYYKDISVYDVTQNSVQHQIPKYPPYQPNYNFNNELNQIVPTSNSVHSSPSPNRNHDSPGTELMKRREDDIDRYYCN